jgi:ectoine hydroxylase-related dioxygenase (phytanoyl-CoA dioxygenase family)
MRWKKTGAGVTILPGFTQGDFMTDSKLLKALDEPYPLTAGQIEQYQADGFIKLKNVLSSEVIDYYRDKITEAVFRLNKQDKPINQRDTYGKAFLQVGNLWTQSDVVKEFVFSKRMARIAAELMKVNGVRMYHDQALYKEASGGFTPWHADQYYWPLSNNNTVTAWVPLQETPTEMGALCFSRGSQRYTGGRDLAISDESEIKISKALLEEKLPMVDSGFDLGEISFHSGWTYHRAGPNTTGRPREVMTIIYMEDGMRLAEFKRKSHGPEADTWMPGTKMGEVLATHLNPVMYRREG